MLEGAKELVEAAKVIMEAALAVAATKSVAVFRAAAIILFYCKTSAVVMYTEKKVMRFLDFF